MPDPEPGATTPTGQQTSTYRCSACNMNFNSNDELQNHNRGTHRR